MKTIILSDFLTDQNIRIRIKAKDWADVVEQAGRLLLITGRIEPRYIEGMKAMIRDEGAYMVLIPGFALLHARPQDGALGECLSLVTLAEPVYFGNPDNDPVDLAIAFAAGESDIHIQILAEVARLLQDEARLVRIRKADKVQDVIDTLLA